MTALVNDRNTPRSVGDTKAIGVEASMTIEAGSIVMRNAAGYAVKGTAVLNLIGVGRAEQRVVNAGAAGSQSVQVQTGTFLFANSALGDAISAADIGSPCWTVDDQTVAKTNGTGTRSIAGFVENVSVQGVFVRFDEIAAKTYITLAA